MDTVSTTGWIIFASAMMIYGVVGIFKGELHFQVGHGWKGIPVTLTGKAGLASSISLIVGGALLIIGTRPLEFRVRASYLGCWMCYPNSCSRILLCHANAHQESYRIL